MLEKETYFSDPTSFLLYVFTAQTLIYWAICQGFFSGDTTLLYAMIKLACFPAYLVGGIMYFRNGNGFMGAQYILFGTLFSGFFGLCDLGLYICNLHGIQLGYSIMGIPELLSFFVIAPTMLACRFSPWSELLTWSLVMVWLLCNSLVFFFDGNLLIQLDKWLALICGILLTYQCAHAFLLISGHKGLPVGKPLCQ